MYKEGIMNVVGYVRHSPDTSDLESVFAQSEHIRRWVADTANTLISVCQDHHPSTTPLDRPGFRALLEIARSEDADAVVIANLAALSPDVMTQEVILQDLRDAGVTIIATEDSDIQALQNSDHDLARMIVRDVVSRVAEYHAAFGSSREPAPTQESEVVERPKQRTTGTTEVVVELRAPTA